MSVDIFLYDDGHEPLLFKDIEKYEITIVQWSVNGSDNVVYIPQNPTGKQQIHVQFAPDSGASAGAVSVLVTHKKGGGCFEPVLLTKSGESLLRLYIPPPSNTAKLPAKILDWVEKHYVSAEIPDAIRDRLIECARFCVSELAGSEDVSAQASLSDLIARLFPYPPMEFSGADCLVVAGSGTDGLQTSSFRLTTPLRDSIPSHPSLGLSLIRVVPLTSSASACRALGKTLQLPDGQTSNPMIGASVRSRIPTATGDWRPEGRMGLSRSTNTTAEVGGVCRCFTRRRSQFWGLPSPRTVTDLRRSLSTERVWYTTLNPNVAAGRANPYP